MNNPNPNFFSKLFFSLIIVFSILYIAFYHLEYDYSIDWQLTAAAPTERVVTKIVEKGPFSFELRNNIYFIQEAFKASPISHPPFALPIFLILWWAGFTGLIAVSTFWKRYWFLFIGILSILAINFLDLDALSVLGSRSGSKMATIILMVALIAPSYYFHAFKQEINFLTKWLVIFSISLVPLVIGFNQSPFFATHFLANSYFTSVVLAVFGIFLVSEEIIFAILYLTTQSKGSRNNEKHFVFLSIIFIGYVLCDFMYKARIVSFQIPYFDPFYLLLLSLMIGTWSFRYKQEIFDRILAIAVDIRFIFLPIFILIITYFLIGFSRGNDASYAAMHYIIVYFHLGFGGMFFIYIIANFINPLIKGIQIFKVVYKEQNFPYVTARIGGLVVALSCFFLSDQEALKVIKGAKYAYQGDIYESQKESRLAGEYYKESFNAAADNHYAAFQLATYYENSNRINDALYRYNRATVRHPSSYAFVNLATMQKENNDLARAIKTLREGSLIAPSNQLNNNLAVYLFENGNQKEANSILDDPKNTAEWNDAMRVNKWRISLDSTLVDDFQIENAAVKTNILGQLIRQNITADLEPTQFIEENANLSLPQITYLINANLYFQNLDFSNQNEVARKQLTSADLANHLDEADIFNRISNGNIKSAFQKLDVSVANAKTWEKGAIYRTLGLIALEQNAYILSETFLENGLEYNGYDVLLPLLAAQLESEHWDQAKQTLDRLLIENPKNETLATSILEILNGRDNQSFAYTYYRWKDFEPASLANRLTRFNQKEQQLIWEKIVYTLIDQDKKESLADYESAFANLLTNPMKDLLKLIETPTAIEYSNPFATWSYLNTAQKPENIDEHYNQIVEALEINPYSVVLNKYFCFLAIDMGLYDYADDGLVRLYALMNADDYRAFERTYFDYVYSKKQASKEWVY